MNGPHLRQEAQGGRGRPEPGELGGVGHGTDRGRGGARAEDGDAGRDLTVLSTFSGIGGLDLGLTRAGFRHVGLCERDEYRRAVLAERFPGVSVWNDVADAALAPAAREQLGQDGRLDLLCGGFPCQDLSVAGRRRGLAGERSGLFFVFAKLADALRPRALLIENVPGLLSSNGGRDFGELLGSLADLGYGVGYRVLDSRFFGVPQRRRRVFIVALRPSGRAGAELAGEVLAVGSRCDGHPAAGGEAGQIATGIAGAGSDGPGSGRDEEGSLVVNALDRMAGGPDDNAAQAGHLIPNCTSVRRLTPVECERLQGLPEDWTLIPWNGKPAPDSRRYAAVGDAVTVPVAEWIGRRLAAAL